MRQSGFLYTIPFTLKKHVPLKLINFVTDQLKVNDRDRRRRRVPRGGRRAGDLQRRRLPHLRREPERYRDPQPRRALPLRLRDGTSLRGNIDEVAEKLQEALQEKLAIAGIVIEETRLSHLAYASEIAVAMLKRQQAVAIFQARRYMVENALAIIDDVVKHFDARTDLNMSDDKKTELINSLLIVMTSDKEASPVLNISK